MIQDVFKYARARMTFLGYTEWESVGATTYENIPRPRLDKAFNLDLGQTRGISNNMRAQIAESDFTVRIFRGPVKAPSRIVDEAIAAGDAIVSEFLQATNATQFPGIKNITFQSLNVAPLSKSNDNGVIVEMIFTALILYKTDGKAI